MVVSASLRVLGVALAVAGLSQAPQQSAVHVLKISSGPSGSDVNGNFVLAPERSVFNRRDDREVIVLFLWDGVAGAHRLVAQWRSPDSSVTSSSSIDYMARAPRFGAYWSLPLSTAMMLGTWSIEATVDGVPAGRYTFDITDNSVPSSPVKPLLTQAALYERLNRAYLVLERSSRAGRRLSAAAGFSPGGGLVYTTMSALDGADDIRVLSSDGTAVPVTTVAAWNRAQRWAVLSGAAEAGPSAIATADATTVGSRCVSLQVTSGAGRVLAECSITGQDTTGPTPSLIATFRVGGSAPGAPVFNEFGEIIGLVGNLGPTGAGGEVAIRDIGAPLVTPIVPIGALHVDSAAPRATLADLRARGETVAGVVGEEHVLTGGFGRVDAKGKLLSNEHHEELSLRERGFGVFVMWSPRERLRGQLRARLFDQDNRVAADSKPAKGDFRKGQMATSVWSFPMPEREGMYRVDVLLDTTPIWRGYLRVTP